MPDLQKFFTEYLPEKFAANPDLAEEIRATYQFDIEGFGTWTIDLTEGHGSVAEGPCEEPGCVVTAEQADFETLIDNPAAGMMLFTMGKLRVTNVGLAISLQKILE